MIFVQNLKKIRQEKKLSLQELSDLSGVSKSMLSQIEREEKNPTLQIASQIAEGLGNTLSAMLGEIQKEPVIVIKANERLVYRDEFSGFERHLLSPSFTTKGIEFILNIIPCEGESAYFPPHKNGVKEYVYVAQGRLQVELGNTVYELEQNESIYFEANFRHKFKNIGDTVCRYYLVIDSYEANI